MLHVLLGMRTNAPKEAGDEGRLPEAGQDGVIGGLSLRSFSSTSTSIA